MSLAFVVAGLTCLAWAVFVDVHWFEHHVYELYCNSDPAPHLRERNARIFAGVLGLVLLALAPVAGAWAKKRSLAAIIGAQLTWIVPVVLAFGATELILQKKLRSAPPRLVDPFLPPMQYARNGWYVNEPSSAKEVRFHGSSVHYYFDSRGERTASEHVEPSRSAPTILITGESIGLGYLLPYEKTCAAQLAEAFGVQVVNLSAAGFAADQSFQRLEEALSWFEHPIATVTFVVPVGLQRTVRHNTARLALSASGLGQQPARSDWRDRSALWTALERILPFHSDEAIPLTRAILKETVRLSGAHKAAAVFVMTNFGARCLPDDAGTPHLARELFDGVGGTHAIIDISSEERGEDLHPNEVGERKLTAAITAMLRMAGI